MEIFQSTLTSCDAQTSVEVVEDRENGGIRVERYPVRRNESDEWNDDDQCGVEPMDMFVYVGPCHWRIGNVDFLSILLSL